MQPSRKTPAWKPEESVGFWLNNASRALLRRHEGRLREIGFGMSQLPVLFALEQREAMSVKELAAVARVEQPTMTEMIARLSRDGIVQREPNPEDRRGSLISLTRRAQARIPEVKEALLLGEKEATAGLGKEEQALLVELLQRVAQNLETEG